MTRTLGRGVLTASVAAVLLAGCATSTPSSLRSTTSKIPAATPYSPAPQVHRGRFTAPFELDGGGLQVLPVAPGYVPRRTLASVRAQAWATSQIAPFAPYVVGLGMVTITRGAAAVRPVHGLIAWVALAKSSSFTSCTAFTPPPPKVQPPSGGWSAVVIGDATGSPAVVYQSATIVCNRLVHTSVEPATEVISTPWALSPSGVATTVPSCSTFFEDDFGSSPTWSSFRYLVTIPEDRSSPAVAGSRAMPRCLPSGATRSIDLSADPQAQGVVPTTLHEATGLVREVSNVPYEGPPTTSTTAAALARFAHWTPAAVPGVLGYRPGSNATEADLFSWSGRHLGTFRAPSGAQILMTDFASALSPNGRRILVQRGQLISVMTVSGRLVGSFPANGGVLGRNDSVHVCALRLPAHLSATSTKATLLLEDPGHAGRVVAQVPGTSDHTDTWLVACDPARNVAAVETSLMGRGVAVTYVNLSTGAQSAAPWYRPDQMGTVEISGDGRFAVTQGGLVVQTATGNVVGHVTGEPIGISWLGHVVVVMAENFQNPEVIDWATHRVVWRYRSHVAPCPCSSIWAIASSRANSDDVAVNVPYRADRAVALWLVRFRGSALHLGSVAPAHP